VFKKELEKTGFKKVEYELFDGPFNLFWDVACYFYMKFLSYETVYAINDIFIKNIYKINMFLDKFVTKKGFSNGYFIWGEK
jgi:hypothetical protein